MPTVFVAPGTLGDLLKHEYSRDYCREEVTLEVHADGYPMGAVLGQNTADGVYDLSPATGDTGEEAACAVLIEAVPAGGITGLVLARGPVIVADSALVFDATVNTAPLKASKLQQLAACGIVARTAV